jgi:hypothetical protein
MCVLLYNVNKVLFVIGWIVSLFDVPELSVAPRPGPVVMSPGSANIRRPL